jgi:hypothetical protein
MSTSSTSSPLTVFLSHPVSDYQASNGTYRPEKKVFVSDAIQALHDLGLKVECAALNEDYGEISLEPIEFTGYDVEAICESDIFVLVTSERISRDMYLEIGIAFALGLPIYLFISASAYRRHVTYMVLAFEEMGKVNIFPYDAETQVPTLIRDNLGAYLQSVSE